MLQFALFDYIPKRFLHRATFEQKDVSRMILGFKDGRNVYSRWAARQFARALAATDMKEVVIVCIPASTRYAHVRRWKRFSSELCRLTGAVNGFDRVQVSGSRKRAHVTGEYELSTNIKHYVHIDDDFFRGLTSSEVKESWSSTTSTRLAVHPVRSSVPCRPLVPAS